MAIAYTDLPSDARVLRESREAVRSGYRVTIVAPRPASAPARLPVDDADVVWLDVPQQRGRTTLTGQVAFMRALARWSQGQRTVPAVLHVHNMPDYLFWPLRRWQAAGARFVLDVHDIMSELALHRFHGWRGRLVSRALGVLERAVWRRADAIITVNDLYRDAIARGRGNKAGIHVVLNTPDPDVCRADVRRAPPAGRFKVVFHGTVSHRTGVLHAVRAMPLLLRDVPEAELHIIGSGNAAEAVRREIASLGLGESVRFVDHFLPLTEVLDVIADAHAAVVPNEISVYTAAILPVKLIEYATLGIPIVATRLRLIEEYLGPAACHLIERPEPRLIAEGLRLLARDGHRRDQLSRGGRAFAAVHSWPRYAAALVTALDGYEHHIPAPGAA